MAEEPRPETEANGQISKQGVAFIGRWEGLRTSLYNDALGHCTIGYGHLVHRGRCNGSEPADFKRGISQQRALDLLQGDCAESVGYVNRLVRVRLNQHQFDALVSFAFNVGSGQFGGSDLLEMLNKGRYETVPEQLMRWTNHGVPGLVNRRRAEGRLFKHGRYESMEDSDGAETPSDDVVDVACEPEGEDDVGEVVDDADHPVPEEGEDLSAADRLHRAMTIAVGMGLRITSTTGGVHAPTSYHYSKPYRTVVVSGRRYQVGRAFDVGAPGNPDRLYRRYFEAIGPSAPTELFYDPMGYYYKNGRRVQGQIGGHRDHVHTAY